MEETTDDRFSAREIYFMASEREHWDPYHAGVELPDDWTLDLSRPHCPVQLFYRKILGRKPRRVLSAGGGVDYLGVYLARQGADVVSVDISPMAGQRTREFASRFALKGRLEIVTGACESLRFEEAFDLAVADSALHHMNWERALRRIHAAIQPGGALIAREPVTLSRVLEVWQRHVVIRPPHARPTPLEIMVSPRELAFVEGLFRRVEVEHFQLLNRDMFYGFWAKSGLQRWRPRFGEWDFRLIKRFPFLRHYVQDAIIEAWK